MKILNLFSVENKVVLITGGSRGIGEMIARGYLANGAKVYITSRKEKDCFYKADELSKEYNSECVAIPEDVSTLTGIDNLFDKFCKYENNLDILVNNAGAVWGQPLQDFSEQGWDKVIDLNVKSYKLFFCAEAENEEKNIKIKNNRLVILQKLKKFFIKNYY